MTHRVTARSVTAMWLRAPILNGWPLLGMVAGMLAAGAVGLLAASPGPVAGQRLLIRATAASSLVLFSLAFTASALARRLPGSGSHWLRRNRRQIGLSFAVTHAIHAAALIALAATAPALFAELTTPGTFLAGGLGYLVILAMAATSFDRTAARLGRRAWGMLHTAGIWFLWLSFTLFYGRRFLGDPGYWPAMAVLGLALAVRSAGALKKAH